MTDDVDFTYDQYAAGGCFGQVSDAAGGDEVTFNQYAAGGPWEQLRVLIDPEMTWNQYSAGGVLGQAEVAVESEGEGGDVPEWVPATAAIHIDLLGGDPQGRAWTEADGAVAVDTLLGDSALLSVTYDPDNLEEGVGYVGGSAAFIGAAATELAGDFTIVIEFDDRVAFAMAEDTFTVDLAARYGPPPTECSLGGSDGWSIYIPAEGDFAGDGSLGAHKLALTYVGDTGYASCDGVKWETVGETPELTLIPVARPVPCTDFTIGSGAVIRSITLYAVKSEEETRLLTV